MTVVAAIAHEGHVFMASDSLTQYVGTRVQGAVKVRRLPVKGWEAEQPSDARDVGGDALFAASGNGALVSLARRRVALTAPQPGESFQDWAEEVAVSFTEMAHEASPPLTSPEHDGGTVLDGSGLIGFRGQLAYLFTHQAVVIPPEPGSGWAIAALGSGTDVALGAMHAVMRHGGTPVDAIGLAVTLGCRFAEGCAVGADGVPVLISAGPLGD